MTTQGSARSEPAENATWPLPPPSRADIPDLAAPDGPPPMRIGRVEREAADARLREALRDDVITIMEYDERLGMVLAARTQQELDKILVDLPGAQQPATPPAPPLPECSSITAVMSNEEQRGRWRPANPLRVVVTMGSAIVDLRDAVTEDGTFNIDAKVMMGNVEVVVPDDATVVLTGFAVMGEKKNAVDTAATGGPHVTVNGQAVMGSVQVRTASRRERRRHPSAAASGAPHPAPLGDLRRSAAKPRWFGRVAGFALLAALLVGPGRAGVDADAVALFGSTTYEPTPAQLSGEDDVDVLSLFGSVEVAVPDSHGARIGGVRPWFGSANCHEICGSSESRPQVEIDGTVLFGSLEVGTPPSQPSPLSGSDADAGGQPPPGAQN